MFSRKIRHVAIRSGSIRWISIRFDADKTLYSILNNVSIHPGLTTVSVLGFFYLKSNVFWFIYNSTIFYFTDLFILYIFIQNAYADIKGKKDYKLCLIGQIVIYSHSFLEY